MTGRAEVGVVGAGLAGLAAAGRLREAGVGVRVYEARQAVGGRLGHGALGPVECDGGAQYFTVRRPEFRRAVEAWTREGIVAPWEGRTVALREGETGSPPGDGPRLVGVPRMNAPAGRLAEGLEVVTGAAVRSLARRDGAWRLAGSGFEAAHRVVVLALPADRAAALAAGERPDLAARCAGASLNPCWAVAYVPLQPLGLGFDGAFVQDSPLQWAARDTSKPGREGLETWVLHASAAWSSARGGWAAERACRALLSAFFRAADRRPVEPREIAGRLWRHARAESPLEAGALAADGLAVCGDWAAGNRVEGAYISGRRGGEVALRSLAREPGAAGG